MQFGRSVVRAVGKLGREALRSRVLEVQREREGGRVEGGGCPCRGGRGSVYIGLIWGV
jgi:hypothetical protein